MSFAELCIVAEHSLEQGSTICLSGPLILSIPTLIKIKMRGVTGLLLTAQYWIQ